MARIESFIPKTTRLVIRRATAMWYETKEEIILDMDKVEDATCPMTNKPVRMSIVKGITVYFQTTQIRTRLMLDEGDVDNVVLNMQMSNFNYDIHGKRYPNPSLSLYPVALRLSESCWLVRTDRIPWHLIHEMEGAGCTVHVDDYDKSQTEKLVKRAIRQTIDDVNAAIERNRKSAEDANAQLENSENEEGITQQEAEKRHENHMKAISKRMAVMSKAIGQAAALFGIRPELLGPGKLNETAKELKSTMRKRMDAYTTAAKLLKSKPSEHAQSMAKMAEQDEAPIFVLTDLLQDEGEDEAAQELKDAFEG